MEEKAQDAQCYIKRNASPTGSPDDGNLESKIDSGKTAACRNQRHHGHRSVKQRRSGCFGGCTGSARDSRANRQGSQWRRSSGATAARKRVCREIAREVTRARVGQHSSPAADSPRRPAGPGGPAQTWRSASLAAADELHDLQPRAGGHRCAGPIVRLDDAAI